MNILTVALMLSYLSLPTGTVMGHSQYKSMADCERAVANLKAQQPDAVGVCTLATVSLPTYAGK